MTPGMSSVDHVGAAGISRSGSAGGDDSDNSPDEGNPNAPYQSQRLEGGRWYGESVSTSIAPIAVLEQVKPIPTTASIIYLTSLSFKMLFLMSTHLPK
jgi:hypothetical protein